MSQSWILTPQAQDDHDEVGQVQLASCERCHGLTDCPTIHNDAVSDCPFELCQACTELDELNIKIAAVHEQLASLVRQRQALKSRVNLQHDQLTSRLPMEIVCEIFVLFTERGYSYETWEPKDPIRPPLLLGSVCKRWRDITLTLPRLWSTLDIAYRGVGKRDGASLPKEWLHRTIREPLRVIYDGYYYGSPHRNIYRPALQLAKVLRSHADRWRHFSFSGQWKQFHGLFNNMDEVPQLETLSIRISYSHWQPETFREPIQLRIPMAPINLTIYNAVLDLIPLQWTNLTHLEVDRLQLDEFLHIIRHARNLVSCSIDGLSYTDPDEETNYSLPTTPIVHPLVKTIKFRHADIISSLRYLCFPSLERSKFLIALNFPVDIEDPSACIETLGDFFNRSGLRATLDTRCSFSLHLGSRAIPVPWFQLLPCITHLKIVISDAHEFFNIEPFFRALAKTSGPPFLPHLEEVRLVVDKISRSDCIALCDALRAHTNLNRDPEVFDEVFKKGFEESNVDTRMLAAEQEGPQPHHAEFRCARPLSAVHIRYRSWGHSGCIDADIITMIMDIIATGFRVEIVDSYNNDMLVAMTRHIINRELPFSADLIENPNIQEGESVGQIE